jgi:hypothetical protein
VSISREVLAKYIKPGITVFRECGSRWGDTLIKAMDLGAGHAAGCEVETVLAVLADMHVKDAYSNATVHPIDSRAFLGSEPTIKGKEILLFLDAHTEKRSSVMEELDIVSGWKHLPYAILIDDLRCMPDWNIEVGAIYSKLGEMGYRLSREDGVVKDDILVAQL